MWAARSPDLTPMDFFLWGFVKDKVYRMKVRKLAVLKQRIRNACAIITVAMFQKVFRATVTRWNHVLKWTVATWKESNLVYAITYFML